MHRFQYREPTPRREETSKASGIKMEIIIVTSMYNVMVLLNGMGILYTFSAKWRK